ncbi:hypothetical protein D5S18_08085 [Nocardia panacis]|uniref:Uncharacterized protein n=1 Tax=Nocardia panacis TaxID=2340916 RepID=A0A3A4KLE4_9NOCA|nr:hypothetical protein D5S18_08085 [Nocardia panacis]
MDALRPLTLAVRVEILAEPYGSAPRDQLQDKVTNLGELRSSPSLTAQRHLHHALTRLTDPWVEILAEPYGSAPLAGWTADDVYLALLRSSPSLTAQRHLPGLLAVPVVPRVEILAEPYGSAPLERQDGR